MSRREGGRKAERRGTQAAGRGAGTGNKAGRDGLFYTGHNSKQQTLARQRTKKKKEKGRRFADVRLLITHPRTAHVCICMHCPRKPLYDHKSFCGGGAGERGPLHASTLALLFLTQAGLWSDSNLASFVLRESTKCPVALMPFCSSTPSPRRGSWSPCEAGVDGCGSGQYI